MATFEIETNSVTTKVNEVVEVEVQSFPKIAEPIDYTWEASVQPESYAIIPTNLMGETGNLSDTVLAAIEAAYEAQLDPGGTLHLVLDGLQSSIDLVETGVNQNVNQINTTNANVSALETTVVSRLDSSEAAILSLEGTVAAIDYSQAYIVASINSAFGGDLTAHIGSIASTYVDANSAIAADLTILEVAIGNQEVSIETLDTIVAGYYSEWDGISVPVIGQFKFIGTVQYQYLGGTFGELGDGWVRTDQSASEEVDSLNTTLTGYVDGLIGDLQNQIDGSITTWFDDYEPTSLTEPWATWLATDTTNGDTVEQDRHAGDIFYDTSSGYGYRFIKTIDVFSWSLITDNAITQALAAAAAAQATADGKVTVWYQATAPAGLTTEDIGDMWVDTAGGNITKVWNGTAWEDQTNATADQAQTWAANASKLITDPNGNITGWEFGDGSNTESVFKIHADQFQVSNTTTGLTPFSIDGTDILFNGKVTFSNVTGVPNLTSGSTAGFYDDLEYEDDTAMQAAWVKVHGTGPGSYWQSSTAASGAKSIGIGNDPLLDGEEWLEAVQATPIAADRLYKMSVKLRSYLPEAGNTAYAGLVCYAADGVTKLNLAGADLYTSQHYVAAAGVTLTSSFVEYVGYFKGQDVTGVGGQHNDPSNPAKLYSGTKFVKPMIIGNYQAKGGYTYFDEVRIEDVSDDYAALINANTTTIDGGSITTYSINTNHIATAGLNASVIKAGVIYNTGGSAGSYTMKVDLDNGEIHIK